MREVKLLALFVCKVVGLFRLARYATRHRLRILCYHGFELADEAAFRPKLFMSATRFERRLATIRRRRFRVLPLDEALDRLYAGTLARDALVITVDDGFHAVSRIAAPLLRQHGYAATVYVTTYYMQRANPVFRLVVQYMHWKTRADTLRLENVPWSDDRVVDLRDPAESHRAMWQCIEYGERSCTEDQRRTICERLGELLGVAYDDIVRSKILTLMTPEELRGLEESTMTVELHTHRHTFPADDRAAAEREIVDNRAALALWLQGDRRHFSYPSGLWDERQWPWLDAMRVKSATTCVPGLNDRATPRYALHRFLDGESVHQLEFEAALSGFTDLTRGLLFRGQAPHALPPASHPVQTL